MIVIYHDVGGSHSSVTAANIHINKLPYDRVPDKKDILALPNFDSLSKSEQGHLIYIGQDEFGSKVYTISRLYQEKLVVPAIIDTYKAAMGTTDGLYLVNTSPTVNNLMRIGGGGSRRLGLVKLGRPIAVYGTLKTYMNIVEIVKDVKSRIESDVKLKS
jgi:hypothetical protein